MGQNYVTEAYPPLHPRLQGRLGNTVGIFFLTWALYYPSWECVSQDEVKNEIFDDVEIKNIHPFVFCAGIKCICAKHLRVLDELVVHGNSASFSLPVFPPPRL